MRRAENSKQSQYAFQLVRTHRARLFVAALVAVAALAFAGYSLYSRRVIAQDRRSQVQQDLAQRFVSHEDFRIDVRTTAQRLRNFGHMSLVTPSRNFEFELRPNDLRAPNYRAEETGPGGVTRQLPAPEVTTYKGSVAGVWGSDVRFTIDDDQIEGMILSSDGSYFVEPAQKYSAAAEPSDYVIYRPSDVREDITRSCADTLDHKVDIGASRLAANAIGVSPNVFSPFRVVEMATESDFEYTTALGGAAAANSGIISIMNQIQAIYERDIGLTFTIVFQHAWTTADPFTTTGPSPQPSENLLNSFTNYWNTNFTTVSRDDTHMWTGKNLGGPNGIAWDGTVCRVPSAAYGLSDVETMAPFQVGIPAHEIGHNFHAQHSDGVAGCDNTIMASVQTQSTTLTFCAFSINEITTYVNANSSCLSQAQSNTIQFSASSYTVNEGGGSATITVVRGGDTSGAAAVDYKTADADNFTVGCDAKQGTAFGRCDFATVVGTVSFAAGETSRTVTVPIINDSYGEGNETFSVGLSHPVNGTLGSQATATVTIADNEIVDGANPILQTNDAGIAFFVRQHYLDFLAREPEPTEPWSNILRNCADQFNTNPNSPSVNCDRIMVSNSFFGSPEFKNKGVYVIDFYRVAFNRLPTYSEFAQDLASVTGATAAETNAKRAAFAVNFALRTEFTNIYGTASNADYVNALMGGSRGQNYNLTSITTPDPANPDGASKVTLTSTDLISSLNGGSMTRATVLRAIVQSDQITNIEAINVFVSTQYYGYLRRTPDTTGFNSWVTYLRNNPTDFRTMVNGFVNSREYRLRFGPA